MTKGDIIVIAFIISSSLIGILGINNFTSKDAGKYVLVEVNGKQYAKYDFEKIYSNKLIEIKNQYGYNKIEITNNKVRIVESDCPNQLCIKTGWIEKVNQIIVCLPNRLVVKIVGSDSSIDGVTF